MTDREQIAGIIQGSSGDIAYGYFNEKVENFVASILLPIADEIIEELGYTRQPPIDKVEAVARVTCCFAKENKNCGECQFNTPDKPFPNCFSDVEEQTHQILALFPEAGYRLPGKAPLLTDEEIIYTFGG